MQAFLVLLLVPGSARAQHPGEIHALPLAPLTHGGAACAVRAPLTGPVWEAVLAPHTSDRDAREHRLELLGDSLRAVQGTQPADSATLHGLMVVLGALTDIRGGSGKIDTAEDLRHTAHRLLALHPTHAAAHHMLGRLHAAVLRMGRIERFMATHILGGGELGGASWEKARHHLELAVEQDPCTPDYLYELARLYFDLGETAPAHATLARLLRLPIENPRERHIRDKALALLEDD